MRRTLAAFALAMGVPALAADAPRALIRSGERVAGVAIGGIDRVAALDRRALALRLTSSSLAVAVGDATRTVVATGDRLPSPLTGTFEAIELAASHPSGVVAFAASLNSPIAGVGIFVVRGRRIVPTILFPQRARVAFRRLAVSGRGNVAYATVRGALGRAVRGRPGVEEAAVSGGTRELRLLAIDDAGVVGWIDEGRSTRSTGRVGYWDENGVLHTVAEEGREGPLGPYLQFDRRRSGIDVLLPFGVVFAVPTAEGTAVLAWSPTSPDTRVLARNGDLLDGRRICQVGPALRLLDDGAVAMQASVEGPERCTDTVLVARHGALSEDRATSIARPTPEVATQSVVVGIGKGRAVRIVGDGDDVPAIGRVVLGDLFAAGDGRAIVTATRESGEEVLLTWSSRGRSLRRIDAPQAAAGVRAVAAFGERVAWIAGTTGSAVGAFLSSIDAPPVPLTSPPPFDGAWAWSPFDVAIDGERVVVGASARPGASVGGLFESSPTSVRALLLSGDPLPGTDRRLGSIATFRLRDGVVVFGGYDDAGGPGVGTIDGGVVEWIPTVAQVRDRAGLPLDPYLVDRIDGRPVFTTSLGEDVEVFEATAGCSTPFFGRGGGRLRNVSDLAVAGRRVVVAATVDRGPFQNGIFAGSTRVRARRRPCLPVDPPPS